MRYMAIAVVVDVEDKILGAKLIDADTVQTVLADNDNIKSTLINKVAEIVNLQLNGDKIQWVSGSSKRFTKLLYPTLQPIENINALTIIGESEKQYKVADLNGKVQTFTKLGGN